MPVIVRVAVPRPLWMLFDYLLPDAWPTPQPGARVRVPFGATELIGIAVATLERCESPTDLKSIFEVIDAEPILRPEVFELIRWAADYYHHPPGEALLAALPVALRKGQQLQPLLQRFWRLRLPSGTEAPLPNRAVRQVAALMHLRGRGGWTSQESLTAAGVDARTLNVLVNKSLIEA
ncbi:MAG: primosomal protein N', partial [Proteobacteria bacterium]|nr:primosomal protein N' [Pseudomonadota bacterium]